MKALAPLLNFAAMTCITAAILMTFATVERITLGPDSAMAQHSAVWPSVITLVFYAAAFTFRRSARILATEISTS